MIHLSEVVNDPDFAQAFTIQRSQGGAFGPGGWMDQSSPIAAYGVIQPARAKDLKQIPEGDRVTGAISIIAQQEMFITHNDPTAGLSDIVVWQGNNWRVMSCDPWVDFGFYKTIAVRMEGD